MLQHGGWDLFFKTGNRRDDLKVKLDIKWRPRAVKPDRLQHTFHTIHDQHYTFDITF
jgi:hypothetical protein